MRKLLYYHGKFYFLDKKIRECWLVEVRKILITHESWQSHGCKMLVTTLERINLE